MDRRQTVRTGRGRRSTPPAMFGLVAVLFMVLAAACSGVPNSTAPQVVRTLAVNAPSSAVAPPPVNADRREIVSDFLANNAGHDPSHLAALQYLTKAAAQAWKPTSAVIMDADAPTVPAVNGSVTLRGTEVGVLSAGGGFSLPSGSTAVSLTFRFQKTGLGWRITNPLPNPGTLLLRADDYTNDYRLTPLYFFNTAQKMLVPDLRYSSATGQSLADFLLAELLLGPQSGTLTNLANVFGSQIDQKNAKVTLGQPIVVQLPGFRNVARANQTLIAAELAYSFRTAFSNNALEIQDGTRTVALPSAAQTFTTSSLPASFAPTGSTAHQSGYYIRQQRVFSDSGHRLTDTAIGSRTGVSSVAVGAAPAAGAASVLVATVSANKRTAFVDSSLGTMPVPLPAAATSRPEWTRDGSGEVWLGVGRRLLRVTSSGTLHVVAISAVQGSSPLAPREVTAVRFSPDGARVALVLAGAGASRSSSAWLGNVVRSGGAVQVQGLRQFTPTGWYVRDVAWTDPERLEVIDNAVGSYEFALWSVRCDGSDPQQIGSANDDLPGSPRYVTAGRDGTTWVSVGSGSTSTLWTQTGSGAWTAPFGTSSYVGSAPVFST